MCVCVLTRVTQIIMATCNPAWGSRYFSPVRLPHISYSGHITPNIPLQISSRKFLTKRICLVTPSGQLLPEISPRFQLQRLAECYTCNILTKFWDNAFYIAIDPLFRTFSLPEFRKSTDCIAIFKRHLKSHFNIYLNSKVN